MRALAAIAALVFSFAAAPAVAQQQRDRPFPYRDLATNVVGITPPQGWRTAFFDAQALGELGELTPDPDVTQWRDLLSYLTIANRANQPVNTMDAAINGVVTHCRASAVFNLRPANAVATDGWAEVACVDESGLMQIYVFRGVAAGDATFRFWRSWRGAVNETAPTLRRLGFSPGRITNTPSNGDLQTALAPIMQALTNLWSAEIGAAFEICDLAGAPCASLNHSLADVSAYTPLTMRIPAASLNALAYVEGDRADMAGALQYYRQTFRSEPPDMQNLSFVLTLSQANHRFENVQSMLSLAQMIYFGAHSSSGTFAIYGDNTPLAEQALQRAYLLKVARIGSAVRNGPAYDSFRFDLWPNQ